MTGLTGAAALALAAVAIASIAATALKAKPRRATGKVQKRDVLTTRAQPMYFRLVEALPEHVVLAQVAFSALVTTTDTATRNTFDRKYADFVICSKAFQPVTVVELDDSTHHGRKQQDAARAAILENAGIQVIRYRKIPDTVTIRTDVRAADMAVSK